MVGVKKKLSRIAKNKAFSYQDNAPRRESMVDELGFHTHRFSRSGPQRLLLIRNSLKDAREKDI